MDQVFGLKLNEMRTVVHQQAPREVTQLADARWQAKQEKDWAKADELRKAIEESGWVVKDGAEGYLLQPKDQ